MPTPTASNRFEKQELFSNLDRWGEPKLNGAMDRIDESLDGIESVVTSGGTTVLTGDDYVANQSRQRILVVSGTLNRDAFIQIPSRKKWYWIRNITSGFKVRVRTASMPPGAGTTIPADMVAALYCNGSAIFLMGATRLDQLDPPTKDLDMGLKRIVRLGAGVNPSDAATVGQIPLPLEGGEVVTPLFHLALWHLSA